MDRATNSFLEFLHLHKEKTFRPKKRLPAGTLHKLHKQAEATLGSGIDLREVVKVPQDERFEDWLAVNTGM
jgi:hypothetical protein